MSDEIPALRRVYTHEEKKRLLSLRDQGVSWAETCRHFPDRTLHSLRSQYSQYLQSKQRLSDTSRYRKPYSATERETIMRMRDEGCIYFEIAKVLKGRKPSSISDWYRRHTDSNNGPQVSVGSNWTPVEDAKLSELRTAGKTRKAVAQHFTDRTVSATKQRRFKLGL